MSESVLVALYEEIKRVNEELIDLGFSDAEESSVKLDGLIRLAMQWDEEVHRHSRETAESMETSVPPHLTELPFTR